MCLTADRGSGEDPDPPVCLSFPQAVPLPCKITATSVPLMGVRAIVGHQAIPLKACLGQGIEARDRDRERREPMGLPPLQGLLLARETGHSPPSPQGQQAKRDGGRKTQARWWVRRVAPSSILNSEPRHSHSTHTCLQYQFCQTRPCPAHMATFPQSSLNER